MKFAISLLLFLVSTFHAELVFKINSIADGSVSYDQKAKYQKLAVGEDAFCTSEFSLVVGDGIGSSSFISYCYASVLTYSTTVAFLYQRNENPQASLGSSENIVEFFDSVIMNEIDRYGKQSLIGSDPEKDKLWYSEENEKIAASERIVNAQKALEKRSPSEQVDLMKFQTSVSTTLVGAFLESTRYSKSNPNLAVAKLNIYQRGDSTMMIYRPLYNKSTKSYVYVPVYQTVEIQEEFNFPYQFNLSKETSFGYNIKKPDPRIQISVADSFDVKATDLVIVGSDGFFDNVHISFITYLVNFLVTQMSDEHNQMKDILAELTNITEKYLTVFRDHYENLKMEKKPVCKPPQNTGRPRGARNNLLSSIFSGCCSRGEAQGILDRPEPRLQASSTRSIPIGNIHAIEVQNSREKFFKCSPEQIIGERDFHFERSSQKFGFELSDPSTQFSSDCVKNAILGGFAHSINDIENFTELFKAKRMSKSLLLVAKIVSKEESRYPSPFVIGFVKDQQKWPLNKILKYPQVTGKVDDITVVTGLVVEKAESEENTSKRNTSFLNATQKARIKTYANYQEDVIHFYENADLQKLREQDSEIVQSHSKGERVLI